MSSPLKAPSGWFEMLYAITDLMGKNCINNEDLDFLNEVGVMLAKSQPLPQLEILAELIQTINLRLDENRFGSLEIIDEQKQLKLLHKGIPGTIETLKDEHWVNSFASILKGLYSEWLNQSGATENLVLVLDKIKNQDEITFILKRA